RECRPAPTHEIDDENPGRSRGFPLMLWRSLLLLLLLISGTLGLLLLLRHRGSRLVGAHVLEQHRAVLLVALAQAGAGGSRGAGGRRVWRRGGRGGAGGTIGGGGGGGHIGRRRSHVGRCDVGRRHVGGTASIAIERTQPRTVTRPRARPVAGLAAAA